MKLSRSPVVCAALLLTTAGLAATIANPAAAARPSGPGCGSVITQNTTLSANIGPCSKGGLIIGANGVTLDLNGFAVTGRPGKSGDGAGILISGRTGVTVKDGRVSDFDGGVVIVGGSGSSVDNLLVSNNIGGGKGAVYGDGILISSSSSNTVTGNDVIHNGPFDGIGLLGASSDNLIENNVVSDSNVGTTTGGIRVEGPGATNNTISGNSVDGSALEGIAVFSDQQTGQLNTGNLIENNLVVANGFGVLSARPGDGIRTFLRANSTVIRGNTVQDNAGSGISIGLGSLSNEILLNTATGNGRQPTAGSEFDLQDANVDPPCDANVWSGNVFGTANQACTTL